LSGECRRKQKLEWHRSPSHIRLLHATINPQGLRNRVDRTLIVRIVPIRNEKRRQKQHLRAPHDQTREWFWSRRFFLRQFARIPPAASSTRWPRRGRETSSANGGVRRGQRSTVGSGWCALCASARVLLCTHPQLGAPAQVVGGIHFLG
jgi:hypothetical protein